MKIKLILLMVVVLCVSCVACREECKCPTEWEEWTVRQKHIMVETARFGYKWEGTEEELVEEIRKGFDDEG